MCMRGSRASDLSNVLLLHSSYCILPEVRWGVEIMSTCCSQGLVKGTHRGGRKECGMKGHDSARQLHTSTICKPCSPASH